MNHFQILFIMIGININLPMLLMTLTLFSCARRSDAQCENNKIDQVVEIGHSNKVLVHFKVDSAFLDVSEYLTIEHWGTEETKRFTNMGDTLTLSWYSGLGKFTDSTAYDVIKNRMGLRFVPSCNELRKDHEFNEIHGFSSQINCNGEIIIIFFGINKATDKLVIAQYKVKEISSKVEDSLYCILDSMRFSAKN